MIISLAQSYSFKVYHFNIDKGQERCTWCERKELSSDSNIIFPNILVSFMLLFRHVTAWIHLHRFLHCLRHNISDETCHWIAVGPRCTKLTTCVTFKAPDFFSPAGDQRRANIRLIPRLLSQNHDFAYSSRPASAGVCK